MPKYCRKFNCCSKAGIKYAPTCMIDKAKTISTKGQDNMKLPSLKNFPSLDSWEKARLEYRHCNDSSSFRRYNTALMLNKIKATTINSVAQLLSTKERVVKSKIPLSIFLISLSPQR